MTISVPPPADADDRLDLHNASIEESAAAAGHCGMTHLPTGRVCQEPQHHADGCAFTAPSPRRPAAGPPRPQASAEVQEQPAPSGEPSWL